jgi:hypothetical protein
MCDAFERSPADIPFAEDAGLDHRISRAADAASLPNFVKSKNAEVVGLIPNAGDPQLPPAWHREVPPVHHTQMFQKHVP